MVRKKLGASKELAVAKAGRDSKDKANKGKDKKAMNKKN